MTHKIILSWAVTFRTLMGIIGVGDSVALGLLLWTSIMLISNAERMNNSIFQK